jgi:hypothetical protein
MKKSQVTVFLIIGIVLVASAILVLVIFYNSNSQIELFTKHIEKDPITDHVELCILEQLDIIDDVFTQSGGVEMRNNSLYSDPIYLDRGTSNYPDKNDVEDMIESLLLVSLPPCISGFNNSGVATIDIDDQIDVDVTFSEDLRTIYTTIENGISVRKGEAQSFVDRFSASFESPLPQLHEKVMKGVDMLSEEPSSVPFSRIMEYASENDLFIKIKILDEETCRYSFFHKFNKTGEMVYNFLALYSFAELDTPLFINPIPTLTVNAGYPFTYQVYATGKDVSFSDSTPLFDITRNGTISFTPDIDEVGTHMALIHATDTNGESDQKYIRMIITSGNQDPIVQDIPDTTVSVGENFNYHVNASDPENDTLVYIIDGIPEDSIDALTGEISFIPNNTFREMITVTVLDTYGNSAVSVFRLEVIP